MRKFGRVALAFLCGLDNAPGGHFAHKVWLARVVRGRQRDVVSFAERFEHFGSNASAGREETLGSVPCAHQGKQVRP